ncbi:choice-of-anchor E domain-containing protein [Pelomonas sp. KK5]|uniref:choice-of-anchor E domain-containing protein n=1 Tax=Pelomonas sp. KK5 TaxID=1855730 RepID=UPI00097C4368|nr:choice-of-anchor E domain-containing protein [Pelomonas sp. KK5]
MKTKALWLAAGLALAGAANAGTVSYSFGNPFETTEINQSGTLGLFDSNLGTLTGISLTFTGANTTDLTLTNNAAQQQRVTATSLTDLYFNSSLAALDALIQAANPVISLSATTGSVTLAAGQSQSFGPLADADAITWDSMLNSILAAFTQAGGGNFMLGCDSTSGISLIGGGGNVGSNQATQAMCGATITYTFDDAPPPTSVPEPAMPALVGIAMLGLWAARRRKS